MKLRAVYLGSKEPQEWKMNEGQKDERKGKTYRVALLLDNVDTVLMKIPEQLHQDLAKANIQPFAVLDVVFEPRVTLELNRYDKPEQLLKITPVRFELVAENVNTIGKAKSV